MYKVESNTQKKTTIYVRVPESKHDWEFSIGNKTFPKLKES